MNINNKWSCKYVVGNGHTLVFFFSVHVCMCCLSVQPSQRKGLVIHLEPELPGRMVGVEGVDVDEAAECSPGCPPAIGTRIRHPHGSGCGGSVLEVCDEVCDEGQPVGARRLIAHVPQQ